jgi:hypothetical protein
MTTDRSLPPRPIGLTPAPMITGRAFFFFEDAGVRISVEAETVEPSKNRDKLGY